jgi:hypothetical protein
MKRTDNCLSKLDRINKTLRHEEADRVPISDFFWLTFIDRWREELGLPKDASPYNHYDLDWICTVPNCDPHIRNFEIIKDTEDEQIVRTGFEAIVRHKKGAQMPYFEKFETDTIEKMLAFEFDDPWDERRYFKSGDNQLAGVSEVIVRDSPAWVATVKSLYPDFPVYGSVCESMEEGWRIIGTENLLLWSAMNPDELGVFLKRVGDFNLGLMKAQYEAAGGMLDGFVIWGDVAYVNGMLFSPQTWRTHFKPALQDLIDFSHSKNLPVIYHGCGNSTAIWPDLIEMGLDCYNPMEAKSGMDVVEKRRTFGHDMAFCGNINVMKWADAPLDELRAEVMTKMNAAKGGGFIVQSDHSVPSNVSAERYEFVYNLVKKHGSYPLNLGEWDIPDLS